MSARVCIGMVVYNEEQFLPAALASLTAQDRRDIDIVISDNASTDRTESICRAAAEKDPRIRYIRQKTNIGLIHNLHVVFDACRSPYFAWGGGHDVWHPSYATRLASVLDENPSVVCAYPYVTALDDRGEKIPSPDTCRLDTRTLNVMSRTQSVLWGLNGCHPIFGIFRSEALRQTRLFQHVVCPDNLLVFEVSFLGAIACVPEELVYRRILSAQKIHYRDVLAKYRKAWFPESGPAHFRLWLTNWRLLAEHLLAVLRAPVRWSKKPVLLAATAFALIVRRGKHMVHDVIEAVGFRRP